MQFPFRFFVVVFVWTWTCWLGIVAVGGNPSTHSVLFLLGVIAPSFLGVVFVYRSGLEPRGDFRRRAFDFRRIRFSAYLFIFLLYPSLLLIGMLLAYLLGDRTADFSTITNFAAKPLALKLVFLAFALTVGGPLAEELGWRGYALERLANSSNARVGSLLLGLIWSFWHLPLFLMKGSWHEDFLGWSGWLSFMVWIVSSSVVMTYIYYSNRRSILSAILLHFAMNLTLYLLTPYSREAFHFSTLLMMVLAVLIIRRL